MIFTGQSTATKQKNELALYKTLILLMIFIVFKLSIVPGTYAVEKKSQIVSLYNFQPDFRRYPKELWPLTKKIQKNPRQDNLIRDIDHLLENGSRGLKDELYELKAFVLEEQGNNDAALINYQKSLELRADNSLALYRHALILVSIGACERATPELRELLWSSKANQHEINYLFAICQSKIDKEKSIALFEKSLSQNPNFQPTMEKLLLLYSEEYEENLSKGIQSVGLSQKILALLEKLIKIDNGNQAYKKSYIKLTTIHKDPFIDQAQFKQAINYARKIVIENQFQSAEEVLVYFDLLIKMRSLDLAQKLIVNAEAKNPKLASSLVGAKKQLAIETIK